MNKKYRGKRPSPSTSATSVNVGTIMHGGDGKKWICKSYPRDGKRIKRWVRVTGKITMTVKNKK